MLTTLLSPFAVGVGSRVGAQISSFVLILVASRSLDLAEFGSYAIGWALSVIFTTLVYTGVYHLLLRAKDLEADRNTLFCLQLGMGGIGSLVMVATALIVGDVAAGGTAYALLALAPMPALASLSAWSEAHLVREGRIRTTSLTVFGGEVVALGAAVLLFRADFGITALILARYAATAFLIIVFAAILRRAPRLSLHRPTARRSLGEAWPLWGSVSLAMLTNYGADLILGAFLNSGAVGAYRAGSRVANTAADVVMQPLGTISWSRFARLETQGAEGAIHAAWKENMALGFALVVPVMLSISLLAPALVTLLLDPSWGPVSGVVAVLALARATDSLTFLLEPTMTCLGRARQQFFVRLCDAGLLILLLLTIGRHSGEAAALAVLLKGIALAGVALTLMTSALRLRARDLAEAMAPGLGLTAVCLLVIFALDPARGALGTAAGLGVTVATLAVVWLVLVAGLLKRRMLVLPTP